MLHCWVALLSIRYTVSIPCCSARLQAQKIFKYGGIVRGIVFLKIEYIRREFTTITIFYSHSTLGARFVLPNDISAGVCSLRGFEIFFYTTEVRRVRRREQLIVPVTGCSPWHDFGALKCQVGQHALAFGHIQVVDDRGLFHTLSGLSWIKKLVLWLLSLRSPVHIVCAKKWYFFLNLTVNVQGAFDDGIQLNITNRKNRLELVEVIAF